MAKSLAKKERYFSHTKLKINGNSKIKIYGKELLHSIF